MTSPATPAHLADGVWGVLPTPFAGRDLAVDHDSLRREVDFYKGHDATGLVALGVFGEAARLAPEERAAVIETVTRHAAGLPVVAGLTALATAPAIAQATALVEAAGSRLAGMMVQVNSPDPVVVAAHLTAIHEAAGTGIVVQDYPVASGVTITTDALSEAVNATSGVVAVKSEAPPTSVAIATLTAAVDVPVFGGLGGVSLLDELVAGSAGAMTGFSHPRGLWDAIRAFRDGGFVAARQAYATWLPLANFEGQPGIGLAIRKAVLAHTGVIADPAVRPPSTGLPPRFADLIEDHVSSITGAVTA